MQGLRELLRLLEPLLLMLLKPLMGLVGGNLLADEMGLGLTIKLHGVQRLMLLGVLRMWLQLRLLGARHRRGVDVLKLRHLRARMHIPIHSSHIRSVVALQVLCLLRLVMGALVRLREMMELMALGGGAAHRVRSIGILHRRGAGLGQVPVHLMVCGLGGWLLAIERRPRRHGASKGHRCGRMGGVRSGSGREANTARMSAPRSGSPRSVDGRVYGYRAGTWYWPRCSMTEERGRPWSRENSEGRMEV